MMKVLRHLPLLMLALLAVAACDKQEDIDRAYTDYRYDIVTYLGQNATGALFEYLGRGDSSSVKLQSGISLNDIKVNERVLLRYDYAGRENGGSRMIDVFGCTSIINDSLRQSDLPPDSLPQHRVKLRSLWRTGPYINLHCQVEYTEGPHTFWLVADEQTLGDDTVCCRLVHDLRGQQGTFWRECYASFNVGALWKRSTLHCLRVIINDLTYPDTEFYDFTK